MRVRRGWQRAAGRTGAQSPALPDSQQPCLPGAQFRCPVAFQREILVQVTGTVELVGEIKVALLERQEGLWGGGKGGGGACGMGVLT